MKDLKEASAPESILLGVGIVIALAIVISLVYLTAIGDWDLITRGIGINR